MVKILNQLSLFKYLPNMINGIQFSQPGWITFPIVGLDTFLNLLLVFTQNGGMIYLR